jgi:catechol 2,3-dioxygenase-like lactoylglutathione lyase family enzyme
MGQGREKSGITPLSEWIAGISSHVGICVPDMEQAKRFYCDLLGFEEAWSVVGEGEFLEKLTHIPGAKETCVQIIVPGGGRIELQHYEPEGEIGTAKINNQGLNHLSFGVKDVWAEYERLSAAGVKFRCEPLPVTNPGHPVDGFLCTYFEDPWGLTLELMGPDPAGAADDDERPA